MFLVTLVRFIPLQGSPRILRRNLQRHADRGGKMCDSKCTRSSDKQNGWALVDARVRASGRSGRAAGSPALNRAFLRSTETARRGKIKLRAILGHDRRQCSTISRRRRRRCSRAKLVRVWGSSASGANGRPAAVSSKHGWPGLVGTYRYRFPGAPTLQTACKASISAAWISGGSEYSVQMAK